ncbi:MAG TPA: hypothetical protein VFG10_03005 [Saprospiraceae bacterium]|nr:hypothetical protein [Saprospiraceae bacterium]
MYNSRIHAGQLNQLVSGGKANADVNAQNRRGSGMSCHGNCTLINSSFLGNVAPGTGIKGQGGGLYHEAGVLTMRDVVFDGNYASWQGSAWFSAFGSIIVQENVEVRD